MLQTVQKERFFDAFRQDSDRLGHGQNFFRTPEGVPKYTKKAKCVGGVVKSHVHGACTPLGTDLTTLRDPYPPQNGSKRSFFGQNSVLDPNSKEFLKNLKYFLGSELIFEKKVCKKRVKKGSK